MRIWLSTAPLAFRLKGAGGGTVDNRDQRGLHLRNPQTCPNKPGHLSYPANPLSPVKLLGPLHVHCRTAQNSSCSAICAGIVRIA